jgi:hypothetical protein
MVSQRKRRLFLALGLAVAFALAVLPASASAVSTLTGESLNGGSSSGNIGACPNPAFSASGAATGPYSGTFKESGELFPLNATFTISSGKTTITGSKSDGGACNPSGGNLDVTFFVVTYTATIHTSGGNFHDEGASIFHVAITASGAATLTQTFTSSLAQPVRVAPTNKDECKDGGWTGYFTNQGQCVSSFQSKSQT